MIHLHVPVDEQRRGVVVGLADPLPRQLPAPGADRALAVIARHGAQAAAVAQQAGQQQGRQGRQDAAAGDRLDRFETRRRGAQPADAGRHAPRDVAGRHAERGGRVELVARAPGERLRGQLGGWHRRPRRVGGRRRVGGEPAGDARQAAGEAVAEHGLMAHAESVRDLAQAAAGEQHVGGPLALRLVLEDSAVARGGRAREGVVEAVAAGAECAAHGAQAEAVGAGQLGGGGGAEVEEHGDGSVAVGDIGAGVGIDGVEVMEVDERVAADAHGEAGVDGDGSAGEHVEGELEGAGADRGGDRGGVHSTIR